MISKREAVKLCWLSAFVYFLLPVLAFAQESISFNLGQASYLWPTNASHSLSSTFAETRSDHFHAALDIKTWGQRGYPIYATRDGILHRMAIGPTGYGKVLYLKHNDGSYSVYAHLLRFNEELQQMADSIRFSDYSSSFDVVLDSLNIQIEQGEQIALSGASGIGPPHLHYELRTPTQNPFNPLLTNLDVEDTIAPTFSGLAVEPLSISTEIDGINRIYTKNPRRNSEFADFGTIKVRGPVGLGVDVFDQANNVSNVYAVYSLEMRVDGRTVFTSEVNQFSYSETDQMHLDRIYSLLESEGEAYQRLYVADGNTLSFYKTYGNGGRLELNPGIHQITIIAADYYGNERRSRATLVVQPIQKKYERIHHPLYKRYDQHIDPNDWQWFPNWVNIPEDDFQQLTLAPLLNTPGRPIYFANGSSVSVNLKGSPQFYFRTSETEHFVARRVHPHSPAYLSSPGDPTYASFPAKSFYDTTSVAIKTRRMKPDSISVSVFPFKMPLRKSFELSVRLDSSQLADTTLSFYKMYPGGKWFRKLETRRKGSYLTAHPSTMGRYLIMSDNQPPRLGPVRIVRSPDDKYLAYISAYDRTSGIDYEKTKIYVNGVRGITEYEPESGRLVYYHPDFIPDARNKVKVIAFDGAGNKAKKVVAVSR